MEVIGKYVRADVEITLYLRFVQWASGDGSRSVL